MWLQGCYSRRTTTQSDADQGLRLLWSGGGALQSPACIAPAAAKPVECEFGGVLRAGSQEEEAGGAWFIEACPALPCSPTSIRAWRPSLYSVPENAAADATIGMSMYQAALIEAEEASAHATAMSHAVLFSRDLWRDQLWQWLDCESKRALRATSVKMHDQVDAAVTALASPEAGFTADELSRAMVRWPGVRDLALLGVRGVACMLPLSTTSLPRLTRLTIREPAHLPGQPVASVSAWGLPEPSISVAASLQVIDMSCCYRLTSIAAVRSYGQLRCLRMPWVLGVSALSPLAACSQLEEVWMAGAVQLKSLLPLEACPRLRKLDLRDCGSLLQSQVGNLQLSCTELAHPSTVELEA
ncbi:hypothetical protein FOA52_004963 [Chlamydomonas sp. UWO 241]|nr:hypothetical protein FOA52_004963 [Chlamydomonas sp. UWO 241]